MEAGGVISGKFDWWIDTEEFCLTKGDSFNFSSTRPHRFRIFGEMETIVSRAITPPTHRGAGFLG